MIDCDAYRNERTQLYESLSKLCMNFNNLNSNEDSIVINEVLKYIYTCYNKRFDILKNINIVELNRIIMNRVMDVIFFYLLVVQDQ